MATITQTVRYEEQGKESGVPIYRLLPAGNISWSNRRSRAKDIIKKDVDGVDGCFELHNFLSEKECSQFVSLTEEMGYQEALISTIFGMIKATDIRNNKRVILTAPEELCSEIYNRVKPFVENVHGCYKSSWEPIGINERLRFYRYEDKEEFKPHYDGSFPRNNNEISFMTFLIYLSDDFEDGCTSFFVQSGTTKVKPRTGSALLFFQGDHPLSPYHSGEMKGKGRPKYVLRSDIMYRRKAK